MKMHFVEMELHLNSHNKTTSFEFISNYLRKTLQLIEQTSLGFRHTNHAKWNRIGVIAEFKKINMIEVLSEKIENSLGTASFLKDHYTWALCESLLGNCKRHQYGINII